MTPRRLLLAFLFGLCAVRLCLIGLFELSPDESYYYLWSEHLDLSYYSKGPGIAVTIWLSTHLFGATEFGIRFFSPILSLITALLMFRLARRMFSEEVAIWTTVALSCVPIYQVGGLLMTIDPLSMCFWMAALYTCWRALEQSPRFSAWWPATGFLIGLGFLCKWTNALQLLSIILLLALTPKYRRELRHAGFWSMLAAFLPCTLPPIIWNAQNYWITLVHLKERGGFNHASSLDLGEFFTFLGGQFGVYSPFVFAGMLFAIWIGLGRARLAVPLVGEMAPHLRSVAPGWARFARWILKAGGWVLLLAGLARLTSVLLQLGHSSLALPHEPLIYAALFLFALWIVACGVCTWRDRTGAHPEHFKPRFLLAFALPILLLYFTLSLREAGEANWTAPGTLSLGLLAVAICSNFHLKEIPALRGFIADHERIMEQRPLLLVTLLGLMRCVRPLVLPGLALGAILSLFILNTDLIRLVGFRLPYTIVLPSGERRDVDPSMRLRGWRTTAEVVEQKRAEFEQANGPVFLIGNKYQTAAILSFYMKDPRREQPGHPAVYIPGSQAIENQFSFWPRYDELTAVADIAREYVAARDAHPERREAISKALAALATEESTPGGKAAEAQRALVRELSKALPDLPLDESFVEENNLSRFEGRNALYITDRQEERAPSTIKAGFKRVEMISCIDLERRGFPLRQLRIFACYGYETPSL